MKIVRRRNGSGAPVVLAVLSSDERDTLNKKAHIVLCCWFPIMIHNPLAALEYHTNMSGLWFGHNLHGYNSLSTDSRLSRARWLHCNDWPCASDSLFQASLAQSPSPPPPFPSIPNLDPDICISTNTASPHLHSSTPPTSTSCFPSNPVFFSINYSCIIQAFPMEINTGAIH